ncbi:MAG: methyltransferase [Candidatus Micrarchaeales archaeon]|nr:methyltransferase [Candidatus Micrarchaeales archaeon]
MENESVYVPAEDSFLLEKAVERFAFGKVLDIGTGSGILGIAAAKKGCEVTFSDINSDALSAARKNAEMNAVKGHFILSDLFERVQGKFNTIIFNPPYLPSNGIAVKHLDGGRKGREVIDRFLNEYSTHVLGDHIVLLLESSINNYEQDVKRLKAEIVGREHIFFEDMVVLKFK